MTPSIWISEYSTDPEAGKDCEGWTQWRRVTPVWGFSDQTVASAHRYAQHLRSTWHCAFVAVRPNDQPPTLPVAADA